LKAAHEHVEAVDEGFREPNPEPSSIADGPIVSPRRSASQNESSNWRDAREPDSLEAEFGALEPSPTPSPISTPSITPPPTPIMEAGAEMESIAEESSQEVSEEASAAVELRDPARQILSC